MARESGMAHLLAVHIIVRLVLLFSPLNLELVLPRVLHLDPPLAGPALAPLKLQFPGSQTIARHFTRNKIGTFKGIESESEKRAERAREGEKTRQTGGMRTGVFACLVHIKGKSA